MPTRLMEVQVRVMSQLSCKYNTSYQPHMITDNMVCAREQGKDACWGDSGGEAPCFYSFNT